MRRPAAERNRPRGNATVAKAGSDTGERKGREGRKDG